MARFFLSREAMDLMSGTIVIGGDDAHHIAYSLRMAVGDALTVCDMQKNEYRCTITDIKPDRVQLCVDSVTENSTELPIRVHLFQSLPKGDKMDYIVQKAVELGVTEITPVAGARCIVRLDESGAQKKVARWQKIAAEAAKQCGRGMIPTVNPPIPFKEAVAQSVRCTLPLFCYEGDGARSLKEILAGCPHPSDMPEEQRTAAVLIGPEGGYDTKEVQCVQDAGIPIVNLGSRILRCETASGFVLACMTYAFEL
ncbi:MAG: 16S rRNA (uracil(1498)-N(3))-methyltransferase [Clostridia bacterium]|nr:16S rRNA (uracil(1498)-N(3))-methyltransferase [Clostridia bacterium]